MANLTIRRGDTAAWDLALTDLSGAAQSLAGLTVWWTVKAAPPPTAAEDLDDASALIRAWWAHDGAAVVDAGVAAGDGSPAGTFVAADVPAGVLTLTLWPSFTTTLAIAQARYDVQLSFGPDDVRTWDDGSVTVTTDVTRRTTVP